MKQVLEMTAYELRELINQAVKEAVNEALKDIEAAKTENFVQTMRKALSEYAHGNNEIFDKLKGIYL
jgi:hypothetical protein